MGIVQYILQIVHTAHYSAQATNIAQATLHIALHTRAGPQSKKWSDQQITVNPTGSIHKKAREKKFDPKKVDFDEGVFI